MEQAGIPKHQPSKTQRTALKIKCLDILTIEPEINDTQLAKRLGVTWQTANAYHKEMNARLEAIEKQVETRMNAKTGLIGGIWQKITEALK